MNDFFNVLSDETRLRCLVLIYKHKELCVCELEHALNLGQSKTSRHLSILKLNGLICKRRCGKWVLYSIHPNLTDFQATIIKLVTIEACKQTLCKQDLQRLTEMENRPNTGQNNV
ncbi:Arsenical resistance operon repressor [Bathymodiolus thermophilus thioautotrophic gill symbiont]|uniref:Arsenical resistance operon repressor n=2 Tax=Bathymodiolus thermophilus thioautotrophic gill symbiont TaxID=2360 RepID=A0A8H8XDU9_9GAMM|nr:metalloregulator ArsR/SmtB family transcription factor [Bathymodiolus thermophilus thioautotrophic gill symbiont]CAB5497009.1 Arsenical resistance operon repressor [Bathymodiolus thermophilus thioautotrophic gill symbiont]SGZ98413.1 Arsenical resistance operon repressor [Bathymodiolus thermophilus thioautotrophic gill symbiont]